MSSGGTPGKCFSSDQSFLSCISKKIQYTLFQLVIKEENKEMESLCPTSVEVTNSKKKFI